MVSAIAPTILSWASQDLNLRQSAAPHSRILPAHSEFSSSFLSFPIADITSHGLASTCLSLLMILNRPQPSQADIRRRNTAFQDKAIRGQAPKGPSGVSKRELAAGSALVGGKAGKRSVALWVLIGIAFLLLGTSESRKFGLSPGKGLFFPGPRGQSETRH